MNDERRQHFATRLRKLAEDVEAGRVHPYRVDLTHTFDREGRSRLARTTIVVSHENEGKS